jgi:NAD+ kinase
MGMPENLVFIRHGESEGNVANDMSKTGNDAAFTPEFRNRHSSTWRLTDKGREQAKAAGKWIKENLPIRFDRLYTSEYLRAMETSALLGIEDARWYAEFYLRERNWGSLDVCPVSERNEKYSHALRERKIDSFYWTPPNGESLAELCLRLDRIIHTLHRECDGKNVAMTCHGEVMWGNRVRLERMPQARFRELDMSRDPKHKIHNCQIIHYTRVTPAGFEGAGTRAPYLTHVRSICPWDTNLSTNDWEPIHRAKYSNEDLLKLVGQTPQLVH